MSKNNNNNKTICVLNYYRVKYYIVLYEFNMEILTGVCHFRRRRICTIALDKNLRSDKTRYVFDRNHINNDGYIYDFKKLSLQTEPGKWRIGITFEKRVFIT